MSKSKTPKVIAFIPARYASTRFPGKPLAFIMGKTLIQRTYENALRCKDLDQVIVATDDQRIYNHVLEFGGTAVMTSESCATGTDRIVEALHQFPELLKAEVILNIQGDEPCVDPSVIEAILSCLKKDPSAVMSTAVSPLIDREQAMSSSVVKCVVDQNENALYFSRSLIPGHRSGQFQPSARYLKHIGIYGFRTEFLLVYAGLEATPLQIAEDLEQLKVLEHGYLIKTALVEHESVGVDLPEDIQIIEQLLCKQNTSLLREESAPPSEKD